MKHTNIVKGTASVHQAGHTGLQVIREWGILNLAKEQAKKKDE